MFLNIYIYIFFYIFCRETSYKKSEAFKENYCKLVELKSLLPSKIPFVVLTATATSTLAFFESNLGMTDSSRYIKIPGKKNIKYFVVKTSTRDVLENFVHIIEEVRQKKIMKPKDA